MKTTAAVLSQLESPEGTSCCYLWDRELLRSKCPAPRWGRTGGAALSGAGTSRSPTIWSDLLLTTARFLLVTPIWRPGAWRNRPPVGPTPRIPPGPVVR